MTDICYIVSFGFSARMLLQTNLLVKLAAKGKRIAVVTPDGKDENFIALQQHPNISIYTLDVKQNLWGEDYLFKRKYYLENLESNPALMEKHVHAVRYNKSKHPFKRIRPFYYIQIYRLIKWFPNIRTRFQKREKKHLVSPSVKALLQKINPKLVVSLYPANLLEAQALQAAKELNIPSLTHLLSWDNITCKGIFPVVSEYFILWGAVMKQELQAYYQIEANCTYVCGVPHFDNHFRFRDTDDYCAILQELGLNPDLPYLFFAMSAQRFSPKEIEIVEWLAQSIEENRFGEELQLVVRPHPQVMTGYLTSKSWLKRLQALNSPRVAINFPRLTNSKLRWSMQKEDMDYLSKLLAGCSISLNSGSTISIESIIFDKPVLITSFDANANFSYWKSARRLIDYTHLKKFIELGGATVVRSFQELEQAIQSYLQNPDYKKDERQHALDMECYQNDGQATERVVEAMQEILNQIG